MNHRRRAAPPGSLPPRSAPPRSSHMQLVRRFLAVLLSFSFLHSFAISIYTIESTHHYKDESDAILIYTSNGLSDHSTKASMSSASTAGTGMGESKKSDNSVSHTTTSSTSTSIARSTHVDQHLLLKVPFYVYEEFLHNENLLNFTDMTYGTIMNTEIIAEDKRDEVRKTLDTFDKYLEFNKYHKHSGDLHFIRSALEHPMRVKDPSKAKLFVVPSLLSTDISDLLYISDEQLEIKRSSHIKRMDDFLMKSPWFKRHNGEDHIAPIAHNSFGMRKRFFLPNLAPHLTRCNLVQYHESDGIHKNYIHPHYQNKRAMYKIFKNASPCNITAFEEKDQDFCFIGALTRFKHGQNKMFQSRRDICQNWMPKYTNYTSAVCGKGAMCPTLSQALVGFHAAGDTISASRLFDTILSGTVPIFTRKLQYAGQPQWYDWSKISYFADADNKTQFVEDIEKILSNKTDIKIKTRNLLENTDLFNWRTNVPFDIYMVSTCSQFEFEFECE